MTALVVVAWVVASTTGCAVLFWHCGPARFVVGMLAVSAANLGLVLGLT